MYFQTSVVLLVLNLISKAQARIVGSVAITPAIPNLCNGIACPSVSHCATIVRHQFACCPVCSCLDASLTPTMIGKQFIIDKPQVCSSCYCKSHFAVKHAVCTPVKCPLITCKEFFKPAGQCCPICKKVDREPFPTIPARMTNLK